MKRIIVTDYDPHWPEAFAAAAGELAAAIGANLITIHHIGSTSIPGMHAKPIIDMLPVVVDIEAVDRCVAGVESLGYEAMSEFGIAGRRFFRRDNPAGERIHNVHVFQNGSPHVERHLAFRNFMRAHPTYASQYAELKRKLADVHPYDMDAYMDGKDTFIKVIELKALEWGAVRIKA
jgi:GrpB-like predicted nucleotidyltransferase (UPF0157 family)